MQVAARRFVGFGDLCGCVRLATARYCVRGFRPVCFAGEFDLFSWWFWLRLSVVAAWFVNLDGVPAVDRCGVVVVWVAIGSQVS